MANRGETMETVRDLIFLGSKITADGDCSHEIKRHWLLGSKAMTNLDSVLKGRDIILLTKVCLVKAIVFPVVTYGCERWIIKKAERRRCLQTVVLEKTLESPLDRKEMKPVNPKGNQPRMFIGRSDAEAEAPILWPPDVKSWPIWKDPDGRKDWWQEEKGKTEDEMVWWFDNIIDAMDVNLSKPQEMVKDRKSWCAAVHGVTKSWTGLRDWTTTTTKINK